MRRKHGQQSTPGFSHDLQRHNSTIMEDRPHNCEALCMQWNGSCRGRMRPEQHLLARLLCALTLDALQLRQQRCLFL
jgi:hypothetical protein